MTWMLFVAVAWSQTVFAGFDEFCGLPVVQGPDAQSASARRDRLGNPIIHVDPGVMADWTMSRRFTLAHECAHHLLGHTTSMGALERYSGGTRKQELEADCWAARALRRAGYERDITRATLDWAAKGHFSSQGYPSGTERAGNIQSCIGGSARTEPRCSDRVSPCTHPAHPAGDQVPCSHAVPAHPRGDLMPCGHACFGPYGAMPCHPNGDLFPCQHAAQQHQADLVPCRHQAHPQGDVERVCR